MDVYVYEVRFDQGRIYRWTLIEHDKTGYWVKGFNGVIRLRNTKYPVCEELDHAVSQLLIRLREREAELLHQVGVVRAKIDACESMDEGMQHMRLIMDGD